MKRTLLLSWGVWLCLAPIAYAWDEEDARRSLLTEVVIYNDKRGDYERAADAAKSGIQYRCAYCQAYYAKALIYGRGVPKDEQAGFRLVAEMPPGVYLAELYADGIGTPRDPVEAYALAIVENYKTCTKCERTIASAKRLLSRLRKELTAEEIEVALERAYARDPDLKNAMWLEKAIGAGIVAATVWVLAVLGGAAFLVGRFVFHDKTQAGRG